MTFEAAVAARLLQASAVAAIVVDRVDWDRRPQDAALPAITIDLITDLRPQHMKGFQRTRPTRVQVNCWAETKVAAIGLRRAVLPVLVASAIVGSVTFQRAQNVSVRPTYERTDAGELYREIIDLTLWHNASDEEE